MINVNPVTNFLAILQGADTGLIGTITVGIKTLSGEYVSGPSAGGITEPAPGTYSTTLTAPSIPGEYLIAWDNQLDPPFTEELIVNFAANYAPTLAQVGALLRARTKDTAGNELGTFTALTRPTDVEATELISQAVGTLSTKIGDVCPDQLKQEASRLAALRAAMLIELSYFPEQVASGKSPYANFSDLWKEGFGDGKAPGSLVSAITTALQNPILPVQASEPGLAAFSFPLSSNIGTRRM